jgi:hypothetical protein
MRDAHELLAQTPPSADEYPARIEALNLCAYDLGNTIAELEILADDHEAQATAEANGESNEAKRKARKCELLRAADVYRGIRAEIQEVERVRFQVQERSHRYAREFRLEVAERYAQVA